MAKEIKTSIGIQASPQKVWAILTNTQAYPNWNPFIKSIEGNLAVGAKIKARIEPPQAKGMTFTPTILKFETKSENWISWLMIVGTVFFSFSIYFLSFQDVWGVNLKFLGPITPLGGLLMILSWAMLIFYFLKTKM